MGVVCDIATSEGRKTLVEAVDKHFDSSLDILVNNVGTNRRKPIGEVTDEDYSTIMRTNVDSMFFLTKDLEPFLRRGKGGNGAKGSVVNVASAAGIRSSGTGTVYALSKGAMVQFTRALACEWARAGIRVNCVAP